MTRTIFERDMLLNQIKNSISKLKIGDGDGLHDENSTNLFHTILTKSPTIEIDNDTIVIYTLVGENEAVGDWKEIGLFDENDNLLFVQNISFTHNQGDRVIVKYLIKI